MHIPSFSGVMATLALGTALTACDSNPSTPPPDLNHRDVRLTLLHTADWHSRLFPYNMTVTTTDAALGLQQSRAPFGGAARINWLIQRERARSERVLHLDSGDCFEGAPIFNFFNGEAEVRALDATGVDGVVIGNHEFDHGGQNFALQYGRWATFPVLAANYQFDDPTTPGSPGLANLARPYHLYNLDGLKVAVIGFGNLSSITSLFDQPNRLGITALNTREVAQFYIDMVQSEGADLVVGLSHLGLTDDQNMIALTHGFDVVLGGHLHIVTDPTQEVEDCQPFDAQGRHWVPELDPNFVPPAATALADGGVVECDPATQCCNSNGACPPQPTSNGMFAPWSLAVGFRPHYCTPRRVLEQHSGAFIKYLGRLDLELSNDPAQMVGGNAPDGGITPQYDPRDGFEIIGHRFTLFPVDSTVPDEPTESQLLEPYSLALSEIANLDNLIGYAPQTISRTNVGGGDSPVGNVVTTAMWRRLGVQTDFSLTNTLGIRDAIPAGPVTLDQIYNVFPFDNQITTLQLSGEEVLEMFDFIARRSDGRGCNSQSQIAGARVVISCGGCDRDGIPGPDHDSTGALLTACAQTINIGLADVLGPDGRPTGIPMTCHVDGDCNPDPMVPPQAQSLCEPTAQRCMLPLQRTGSYALAANDYIAAGGSGFVVLQRNTTQVNTGVQLRDAVTDFVQTANPCGYDAGIAMTYRGTHPDETQHGDDGLTVCSDDAPNACPMNFVCSCPQRHAFDEQMRMCLTSPCVDGGGAPAGRCVLQACVTDMTHRVQQTCPTTDTSSDPTQMERCMCGAQTRAGESCRILSCFDQNVGAVADGRIRMESH